jgi:hypothetical protein
MYCLEAWEPPHFLSFHAVLTELLLQIVFNKKKTTIPHLWLYYTGVYKTLGTPALSVV